MLLQFWRGCVVTFVVPDAVSHLVVSGQELKNIQYIGHRHKLLQDVSIRGFIVVRA